MNRGNRFRTDNLMAHGLLNIYVRLGAKSELISLFSKWRMIAIRTFLCAVNGTSLVLVEEKINAYYCYAEYRSA